MKIELSSHTDAQGSDAYNEDLSQRRAQSARRWLLEKGIADNRITAVGYGERPFSINASMGLSVQMTSIVSTADLSLKY